jgi:multiple sugar transport system substrate-binding protein
MTALHMATRLRNPLFSKGVALGLIALLLLCAGCRDDAQEATGGRKPLRLFIMFISTQQADYFRWAEATYEAAHPDVDVIIEQFPGSSLKDFEVKLRVRYSSRQEPDLLMASDYISAPLARLGLLDEAPDYIERMVQENSLNEMVRDAPYIDGRLYGIVTDAAWQALYYNKAMFREAGLDPERPPRTWEELIDTADRLTVRRPDGTPVRAGFSVRKTGFKAGTADKWYTFLYSAGGTPYSEDGTRALFNSPEGREALDLYREILFDRHIDSVTHEGDQQGFGQGRVAMFLREIHVGRFLQENYPDLEYGVAPIPAGATSVSSAGTSLYAVSEASPHRDEAWRFVQFLMQDEAYGRYVSIGGILPMTRSVAGRPPFSTDPVMQVFLNQEVRSPGAFPMVARASDVMGGYIEQYCYGQIGADELLERAERDVNAVLARNRTEAASAMSGRPPGPVPGG